MKLFKIMTILGFACLLVIGCSEKPSTTIGQAEQSDSEKKTVPIANVEETEAQTAPQVAASAPIESAEIDGMLTQTEKGLAIFTGTDSYIVTGKDLSDMIGKMVKVTGAIAEVEGGRVIEVMEVTIIE